LTYRTLMTNRNMICAGVLAIVTVTFAIAASERRTSTLLGLYEICIGATPGKSRDEADFLRENAAAMTKMMADITIQPTGDVDQDFVEMMVAHHHGAITMAQAQLRYGRSDQLKRIANEIIVTQQQEVSAMRMALEWKPSSADR
jgi:NAD(P)-dependent dehydrogenase (short-subunit alcohol dehydrogenase family)